MAVSNYPGRYPAFPTHRNLLDDVDAVHINSIQSELVSVMRALGTSPQVYTHSQLELTETPASAEGDTGALIGDDDPLFAGLAVAGVNKVVQFDHGTVGNRLNNIERGRQFQCFTLRGSNIDVPDQVSTISNRPKAIRFPKPNALNDPYTMHNSAGGVTLRKGGFWIFLANVVFSLLGPQANDNNGMYQATIDYDGNFIDAMARNRLSGNNDNPVLTPVLAGVFSKGDLISLRVSQNSGRLQRIRRARLSGILLRENFGA